MIPKPFPFERVHHNQQLFPNTQERGLSHLRHCSYIMLYSKDPVLGGFEGSSARESLFWVKRGNRLNEVQPVPVLLLLWKRIESRRKNKRKKGVRE